MTLDVIFHIRLYEDWTRFQAVVPKLPYLNN
jgi:hypothetical protein